MKDCLAPGNTRTPDVVLQNWKPTDVLVPLPCPGGWLVTGWDFDHTEYGRKATIEEWKAACTRGG